ncbi:MAG: LuxR C-terminal-related transcriptional regulator [Candidatus Brocadia sp.]|nr:LuxR C-terminal-related transcriptional regulator [Candidatus Brocadia sp.]
MQSRENNLHEFISPLASVMYNPQAKGHKKKFLFNEEAFRVLSKANSMPEKGSKETDRAFLNYLSSLCSKWQVLLDKKCEEVSEVDQGKKRDINTGIDCIDTLKSYRRHYCIRGTVLSPQRPLNAKQGKQYLFILERISAHYANLPMIFRSLNLNRRERQIVEMLFDGNSNKEIAGTLCLSHNTIKTYMKFLMAKFGVKSRTEIIAFLLNGKARQTY